MNRFFMNNRKNRIAGLVKATSQVDQSFFIIK